MVTIALDARALRRPMAGIGRYVTHLCRALDAVLPEARFVIVGARPLDIDLPVVSDRWSVAWDTAPGWGALPRLAWLRHRAGPFARSLDAAVFLGCSLQIPRDTPGLRTVLIVYDLVHRLAPETLDFKGRIALELFLRQDILRADAVVAISQGTADRVSAWCGRPMEALVRPAIDDGFRPASPEAIQGLRQRLALPARYVLALGTHEPRKNLGLLAQAWRQARHDGRLAGLNLVLAGRPGWRHTATDRCLRDLGPDLRDLGYVDQADLPILLTAAEALCFPSRYEGFGMPVAEALACGTPVIAGDLPEIAEASAGRHHRVPLTVDGVAEALATVAAGAIARPPPARPAWDWSTGARALAPLLLAPPHG